MFMKQQDWLVAEDGNCLSYKSPRKWDLVTEEREYRFYRFLTEVEDVVYRAETSGIPEENFLPDLRLLVRKLLLNSYWVRTQVPQPSQETGTSILLLYDEIGLPLTIQTETMIPGTCTPIHNHGTWGVVATLQGEQKNTFWKRSPTSEFPDRIERIGEQILQPEDIISFTTDAIHCVEAIGEEPTVTLNLYGDTFASKRFQFDAIAHQARNF
jgi:predicted metal-dependent enzyme (double-stranded beta helix superfamily)